MRNGYQKTFQVLQYREAFPDDAVALLAYTYIYAMDQRYHWGATMQRKAKIFMNNRSQAVRLPKDFQFDVKEVFIRREGSDVVLSPRPMDWSAYLAEDAVASQSFMEGMEDLPVQERKP